MTKNIVDLWMDDTRDIWANKENSHLLDNLAQIIYDCGLEMIINADIELEMKFLGSINSIKMTERHYEIKFVDYTCKRNKQVVCISYICKREKI